MLEPTPIAWFSLNKNSNIEGKKFQDSPGQQEE